MRFNHAQINVNKNSLNFFKLSWLLFLLISLLYKHAAQAQNISGITFRDYLPVENIDSLEKIVAAKNSNTYDYALALLRLERSWQQLTDDKFGSNLNLFDSLQKKFNLANLKAAYFYFTSNYLSAKSSDRIKSLQYIYKALNLYNQLRDTSGIIHCYYWLEILNIDESGRTSGSIAIPENSMNQVIKLADKSNFPEDKLYKILAIQRFHYQYYNTNIDTIAQLAKQGLAIIKTYPQLNYQKHNQLNYLANCYFFKHDYKRSLDLHLECLSLIHENQYKSKIYYLFNVANDYNNMNDFSRAEYYYNKSAELCKNRNELLSDYKDAIENLAEMQYKEHKYEEACKNFLAGDSLTGIVQTNMHNKDFADMQVKYETEKKELANKVLQKQKQSYETGILISVVLLGIISLLLFYLYNKNKQLDEYAQFRDQIFTIISHDLRSPVMALEGLKKQASFLIKAGDIDSLEQIEQQLDSSILQMNSLLNNLLAWAISKNPKMDTKTETLLLLPLVKDIVLLYTEVANAKNIHIDVNIPDNLTVRANRNGLNVIVRNLIDNAIKNSSSGIVRIDASTQKKNCVITICNNDAIESQELILKIQNQLKGLKDNYLKNASGLGLQLIAHFTKLHKGSITMESNKKKGTVFTLDMPI